MDPITANISYAVWFLIAAALLGGLVYFVAKQKQTRKLMGWAAAIFLVVGILGVSGFIPQLQGMPFGTSYAMGNNTINLALTGNQGNQGAAGTTYIATSGTTLNVFTEDSGQNGVTPVATYKASIDGSSFGTITEGASGTKFSPGTTIDLLATNGTTYHAAYYPGLVVPNSPVMNKNIQLNGNSTVTVTLFNTNNQVMTDGCGATNQTVSGSGQVFNIVARMQGSDTDNTQDMVCIVEETSGANVSKVLWDGKAGVKSKPSYYSVAGTSSDTYMFEVPAIVGAQSRDSTVQIQTVTAKSLASTKAYITCYTKEWFLDTNDGKVKFGAEDSLGTLKSINIYDTSFCLT